MDSRTLPLGLITFVCLLALGCSQPSLEDLKLEAQAAYELALKKKPYQLSDLPREGLTKGDDYNNCLNKGFAQGLEGGRDKEVDFCRWHAGIGTWSEYHKNFQNWLAAQNNLASEKRLTAARASAEKAKRKPRKPPYPGAKCWNEPKYNAVLDRHFDNLVGEVDCVIKDMMKKI